VQSPESTSGPCLKNGGAPSYLLYTTTESMFHFMLISAFETPFFSSGREDATDFSLAAALQQTIPNQHRINRVSPSALFTSTSFPSAFTIPGSQAPECDDTVYPPISGSVRRGGSFEVTSTVGDGLRIL
jgi:hypothetical protein